MKPTESITSRRRAWLPILPCVLLAAPALAADYWVDPVHGSDANGGSSIEDAWRTVTHAEATLPSGSGVNTVHLLPGLYDASSGEVFPIELGPSTILRGTEGSESTIVDAGGATLFSAVFEISGVGFGTPLIEGVTLRNADVGLDVVSPHATQMGPSIQVRDIVFVGNQTGARVWSFGGTFGALNAVTFEECVFRANGRGLLLTTSASLQIHVERSRISNNTGEGIAIHLDSSFTDGISSRFWVESCVITDNGGSAIAATFAPGHPAHGPATCTMYVRDTLVAENGGHGLHFGTPPPDAGELIRARMIADVERCTIVGNAGTGLLAETMWDATTPEHEVGLVGSILADNADDLEWTDPDASARYSNIGDGDFAGVDGNFSLDPQFRDQPADDYRLAFASPCIDAGDPDSWPPGATYVPDDPLGVYRLVDGDLDTVRRVDVGAYELAPLYTVRAAGLGETALFEMSGPGLAHGFAALGQPVFPPIPSLFGEVELDLATLVPIGTVPVAADPPALVGVPLPDHPALVGASLTFQGLFETGQADPALATSNAVEIAFD